ncbi:hypothetical protein COW36_12775 [bacterium (Candidatus Blackallbacteria) CG17_big_fil_post_rev_8_21_14_2_50_48_46]|uniref:Uncharacterized protein n=1 Tax=bacterium (Candidatus Blackallbacteria) CG17_big_fil_post_rev_8_21_14_2_50_48_46 TaxID=2014261 RepID=A0A2M7G445_9BACT|nr:MAG: hypothetical protein COW64_02490 [bacterium (Candidatus Blackallbacteria) CG18_big_fil_WC_8_21_14_2_50_49_26]PIW16635.1 MAG: hypothetical protein COW36_12775 [bacterium (Candidatus Blackallbacteria) CG17_big_fil_post_rev_8_21_14_2_50_48_46]PIW46142.1 MAG: hypothetical protein COW20_18035 [bacterium (Candidatus Blackallbacteria) CG13_big_fil_rev_8_21_14_2_50_49_14]
MRLMILLSSALLALSLTACGPTPASSGTPTGSGSQTGTGTGSGTGTGTGTTGSIAHIMASKQNYIAFLNCLKGKQTTEEGKKNIDQQITAISQVPDASWAIISSTYASFVSSDVYKELVPVCGV